MDMRDGAVRAFIVLAATVLLASCGASNPSPSVSDEPSSAESPSPSPSQSESPSPSASPEVDATPEARPSAEAPAVSETNFVMTPTQGYPTFFPESGPPANDDGTVGSGCHPPDSETLPDGVWRGLVYERAFEETPIWINFDLVCSYSFETPPANYSGPPSDDFIPGYYIRNDNPNVRRLTVVPDAIGYGWTEHWAAAAWNYGLPPTVGDGADVWIFVNDGEVTEIHSAYFEWGPDGYGAAPNS